MKMHLNLSAKTSESHCEIQDRSLLGFQRKRLPSQSISTMKGPANISLEFPTIQCQSTLNDGAISVSGEVLDVVVVSHHANGLRAGRASTRKEPTSQS